MNAIRNRVQLIGHLGQNPEIRMVGDNRKMASISVAIQETYRGSKGEKVTDTQWHQVILWGKLADVAEKFLARGLEVAVEGRLVNRNYTDRNGVRKTLTEIQASDLLILTRK